MDNVIVNGRKFVPYISNDEILRAVHKGAELINDCYKDIASQDNAPIFISILSGAYMYTADLMKEINFNCELYFIKVSSYDGLLSTNKMSEIIGLTHSIKDRDVIVLDDIIDTGFTMKSICENLALKEPRSIRVGALIYKPHTCMKELNVDFPCIVMNDNAFIVGYGLDYNERGRNFKDIYILD